MPGDSLGYDETAELVQRAQAGDVQAFAELVLANQQFVYNLALRSLGDPQEAEDISQEAFLRTWQALPNFRAKAQFRTWLYRIVINLCYNRLPRLRKELSALGEEVIVDFPVESPPDPLSGLEADERRSFLHHQVEELPECYQMMITLRFQQDLSYAEIAEVLSLPIGTVKTGLFRARERLRESLRQYEEEPRWMN
jgi:RNA polymerase sigma-70 factor, ECF subfamily